MALQTSRLALHLAEQQKKHSIRRSVRTASDDSSEGLPLHQAVSIRPFFRSIRFPRTIFEQKKSKLAFVSKHAAFTYKCGRSRVPQLVPGSNKTVFQNKLMARNMVIPIRSLPAAVPQKVKTLASRQTSSIAGHKQDIYDSPAQLGITTTMISFREYDKVVMHKTKHQLN